MSYKQEFTYWIKTIFFVVLNSDWGNKYEIGVKSLTSNWFPYMSWISPFVVFFSSDVIVFFKIYISSDLNFSTTYGRWILLYIWIIRIQMNEVLP